MASTIAPFPTKRPAAQTAAAEIENVVFQEAMLKFQKGAPNYFFSLKDLQAAAGTMKTPDVASLAVANFLEVFAAKGNPATMSRDQMMSTLRETTNKALVAAAGKDGKISASEAKKLPANLADDFQYLTQTGAINPASPPEFSKARGLFTDALHSGALAEALGHGSVVITSKDLACSFKDAGNVVISAKGTYDHHGSQTFVVNVNLATGKLTDVSGR